MFPEPEDHFWGYRVACVSELAAKINERFDVADEEFEQAMMGFDDRDLATFAEAAGFERVHVECHIDIEPGSLERSVSFEALLDSAPNPNAPTVREAIAAALDVGEQERFLAELERAFIEGACVRREAAAYLVAS